MVWVIRGLCSALGDQRGCLLTAVGPAHPPLLVGIQASCLIPVEVPPSLPQTGGSVTDGCTSASAQVAVVGWVEEKQGARRRESCPLSLSALSTLTPVEQETRERGTSEKRTTDPESFWSTAPAVQRSDPACQCRSCKTQGQPLVRNFPWRNHSSVPAWKILWTGEPRGLQPMGSQPDTTEHLSTR